MWNVYAEYCRSPEHLLMQSTWYTYTYEQDANQEEVFEYC